MLLLIEEKEWLQAYHVVVRVDWCGCTGEGLRPVGGVRHQGHPGLSYTVHTFLPPAKLQYSNSISI